MDILTDEPVDYSEPETVGEPFEMIGIAVFVGAGMELTMHSWLIDNVGLGIGTSVAILIAVAGLVRNGIVAGYQTTSLALRLYGGAIVFAALLALRASPVLAFINLSCALGLAGLGVAVHNRQSPPSSISEYARTGVNLAANGSLGATLVVLRDLPELETNTTWSTVRRVLVGAALATPVLLVFGGLFLAADEVFADSFRWLVQFEISAGVVTGLVVAAVLTWVVLGLMRRTLISPSVPSPRAVRRLGVTESLTMMGLVNGLFALFVAFQFFEVTISYQSETVSFAQQARNGFFQLVVVAAMVVALVLLVDWWVETDPGGGARLRTQHLTLIGLTAAILGSAVVRMGLYVDAYGLTELRFYTSAFMVWIAFLLMWLVRTVLAENRASFASPAMAALLAIALLLTVINPDRLIASYNLNNQAQSGPAVDRSYLVTALSADAVPIVLDHLDEAGDPCTQLEYLAGWSVEPVTDIRSWNHARSRASSLLTAAREDLSQKCK